MARALVMGERRVTGNGRGRVGWSAPDCHVPQCWACACGTPAAWWAPHCDALSGGCAPAARHWCGQGPIACFAWPPAPSAPPHASTNASRATTPAPPHRSVGPELAGRMLQMQPRLLSTPPADVAAVIRTIQTGLRTGSRNVAAELAALRPEALMRKPEAVARTVAAVVGLCGGDTAAAQAMVKRQPSLLAASGRNWNGAPGEGAHSVCVCVCVCVRARVCVYVCERARSRACARPRMHVGGFRQGLCFRSSGYGMSSPSHHPVLHAGP
jgi:hypothetical protein